MITPYGKLKALRESGQYLKLDVSFAILNKVAMEISDNQAAKTLQDERSKLLKHIFEQKI
tara:strand:+ start:622 stop:801 length:180 start_codon:yes stop_codon:yes gene_type:complete